MKQYHEPIQVEVGDDGLPYSFRWRNRAWNVISVTDRWVLQAGWWRSDGTEKRDYVLVEARRYGRRGDGGGTVSGREWLDSGEGHGLMTTEGELMPFRGPGDADYFSSVSRRVSLNSRVSRRYRYTPLATSVPPSSRPFQRTTCAPVSRRPENRVRILWPARSNTARST